jgi:hypothetical protein
VKGPGWAYTRIAGDSVAEAELQTTSQQRTAIQQIMRLFDQKQTELGKKLKAEGKVDAAAWPGRQRELWLGAREAARPLLTAEQHRRVEQLMIQRQSYNAFRSEDLTKRLELSAEQEKKILASIDAHLARIRDEDRELKVSAERAAKADPGSQAVEELQRLREEKGRRGRLSHRRVWEEIGKVLTAGQREQFNALRGSKPESARGMLALFE